MPGKCKAPGWNNCPHLNPWFCTSSLTDFDPKINSGRLAKDFTQERFEVWTNLWTTEIEKTTNRRRFRKSVAVQCKGFQVYRQTIYLHFYGILHMFTRSPGAVCCQGWSPSWTRQTRGLLCRWLERNPSRLWTRSSSPPPQVCRKAPDQEPWTVGLIEIGP